MRILLIALLLATATASCRRQQPWTEALSQPSTSLVEYRRPKLQLRSVQAHGKDSLLAADIRSWAEGHQSVLKAMAKSVAKDSNNAIDRWDFQGTSDDGNGGLLVGLFGAYQRPKLMAGCKVLLWFDRQRSLGKVYVFEVPLE